MTVEVDGVPIGKEAKRYFLCSINHVALLVLFEDNKGRKVVTDYFEDVHGTSLSSRPTGLRYERLASHDQRWRISQPSHASALRAWRKKYVAKVQGVPNRPALGSA